MRPVKILSPMRRPSPTRLISHRLRMPTVIGVGCFVFLVLHFLIGQAKNSPFTKAEHFPPKIWQSWKVDALSFEQRDAERALTWTMKNPSWRYEVLTDANAMTFVEQNFGPSGFNRPDIVWTYKSLNARIIQADLLRYLIMYAEGGVWADIDVEALRPIRSFLPKRYKERDVDMIIGVETDEPDFNDHPILGSKAQSFCQWTFVCKPRLPVMMRLIENILEWLNKLSEEQGRPISEIELNFDEVLSGTGPSAFTEAILAEMSIAQGERVTWSPFHDLEESTLVGRTLVLPSEAFAAGTGHSDSGNHGGKAAMVKHHFHASSWTSNHPRYRHPIFDEVERCNWDKECVRLWDANTQLFATLPEEEQLKMIAIKQQEDAAAFGLAEEGQQASSEEQTLDPPANFPPAELGNEQLADVLDASSDSSSGGEKLLDM